MDASLRLTPLDHGVRFDARVTPRAARSQVLGAHDGALKISLKAPPVDGAANEELIRFLAKALGVAKRDVCLVRGHSSRRKTLELRAPGARERVLALLEGVSRPQV